MTPSHLLVGRRLRSIPDLPPRSTFNEPESNTVTLTKRMKHLSCTLNQFWSRWQREYLLELRENHRYGRRRTGNERIRVGDVVVLHNEDKHRGFWKLGLVEKLLTGLDGKPRGAVVHVHQRGNSTTLLRRPVQRLYPIAVGPPNSSNSDFQVES